MTDWGLKQWGLTAAAEAVGPFVRSGFLEAWWNEFSGPADDLEIIHDDTGLVPIWRRVPPEGNDDGLIELAGDPDLTDYHAPLGIDGARLLVEYLLAARSGTRYRLDSLPAEAAESIVAFFGYSGVEVDRRQHAVAMRVDLPRSYDDYLMSVGKKQRHEIRRKSRRATEIIGETRLRPGGPFDDLDAFFDLHRQSAGEKGDFMSEARERFFRSLMAISGSRLDVLESEDGRIVAAAVGFQDADSYYLYNSAYDPSSAEASPGIVMLSNLIENAIANELRWFDFLKGDETYKYRLGAVERPRFVIEGQR